jgi:hypothetical protein
MESLILPPNGPIYLDASGFIYSVERIEPYRTLLDPLWRQAQVGQFVIVSSDLVVLETLVKPLRDTDTAVERLFRELFDADEVMLVPATRQLWEEAARLRADEEVSLTARGVRLHGPDGIGVNGQTTASLPPGTVHLGNFRLLQKRLTPNFAGPKNKAGIGAWVRVGL